LRCFLGASDTLPGGHDIDRKLTALGERQARGVGNFLHNQGIKVDAVVCSSAVRARQTLDQLALDVEPSRVEVSEAYYNAGVDTLLDALRALPADCAVALLVGHAPGVPGVALELADPDASDSSVLEALETALSGRGDRPVGLRRSLGRAGLVLQSDFVI
jgi:phosphohistidine phosphatase